MARVRRGALILCLNRPIYFSKSPWFKFHFNIYIARNNDNPCLVFLLRVGLRAGGKGFFFLQGAIQSHPSPKIEVICYCLLVRFLFSFLLNVTFCLVNSCSGLFCFRMTRNFRTSNIAPRPGHLRYTLSSPSDQENKGLPTGLSPPPVTGNIIGNK